MLRLRYSVEQHQMRAVLRTQLVYEAEHKLLNDIIEREREREREDVHVIGVDSESRVGDVIITRRVHASSMHS